MTKLITIFILTISILYFALPVTNYAVGTLGRKVTYQQTAEQAITPFDTVKQLHVATGSSQQLTIPEIFDIATAGLPSYITVAGQQLTIAPNKNDSELKTFTIKGPAKLSFNRNYILKLDTRPSAVDTSTLNSGILNILGSRKDYYGVYVKDLQRDEILMEHNAGEVYLPGSLAKIPVVLLVMMDIDAGIYTLDSTYPVQNQYKHSTYDNIGALPNGTEVTVEKYIYETIHFSNNSAMYHLRGMLGGWEVVDKRTKEELQVYTFHDAPGNVAIAYDVGTVFEGIYRGTLLSEDLNNWLIELMKGPVASLRDGIPAGIAGKEAEVANKVGFLYGKGLNSYVDAAIVYAPTRDYILVVLDKETSVEEGRDKIQKISALVYDKLNQ